MGCEAACWPILARVATCGSFAFTRRASDESGVIVLSSSPDTIPGRSKKDRISPVPAKRLRNSAKSRRVDRRTQIIAGAGIAALALFGLVVPMGAMQFENHDSFCASCHTEGETTFFRRATSPAAADLASFHELKSAARCIDCHSAPGIVGRYVALTYGATDLVSYFSGHYPQPATQDTPIGDGNCTKCHSAVLANGDFNNHFHAFLPKWQTVDPKNAARCVDCHVSHDTTNDAGAAFLNQSVTTQICAKCHAFAGQG
jgi:predicted CXXCH cytochrome family protein